MRVPVNQPFINEDGVKVKACTVCQEIKPLTREFYCKRSNRPLGFKSECLDCNKKYKEENNDYFVKWREEHREEIIERQREYYQERKEELKPIHAKYREEHKEERKAYFDAHKEEKKIYNREYKITHKEQIDKYVEENLESIIARRRRYCQENREKINKYQRERYKNNPSFKYRIGISKSLWKSLKKCGENKSGSTEIMLGFSSKESYEHFCQWRNHPCENCGILLSLENESIDHILPLSLASVNEDCVKLNMLNNLRLVCLHCNVKKGDKIDLELIEKYGLMDLYMEIKNGI